MRNGVFVISYVVKRILHIIREMWIFQILGEMLAHPHEPYVQMAALCDRYTLDFGWGDHEP